MDFAGSTFGISPCFWTPKWLLYGMIDFVYIYPWAGSFYSGLFVAYFETATLKIMAPFFAISPIFYCYLMNSYTDCLTTGNLSILIHYNIVSTMRHKNSIKYCFLLAIVYTIPRIGYRTCRLYKLGYIISTVPLCLYHIIKNWKKRKRVVYRDFFYTEVLNTNISVANWLINTILVPSLLFFFKSYKEHYDLNKSLTLENLPSISAIPYFLKYSMLLYAGRCSSRAIFTYRLQIATKLFSGLHQYKITLELISLTFYLIYYLYKYSQETVVFTLLGMLPTFNNFNRFLLK